MFVQPALYSVDFSVLPPRPGKNLKVMEMEMEKQQQQQQQHQQQQHLKTHSDNNNEQRNKKIYNNENRPEKEMTIMVRILTTTTTDDDEEEKREKKTKTKKEKEKERERDWPLWTLKWFTHQHRHRTPPAAQAIVCCPSYSATKIPLLPYNPSITTYADICIFHPFFRKIASFLNSLDHMILWSLWFRFLLERRIRR